VLSVVGDCCALPFWEKGRYKKGEEKVQKFLTRPTGENFVRARTKFSPVGRVCRAASLPKAQGLSFKIEREMIFFILRFEPNCAMTLVTTGATYIYIEECEIALKVKVGKCQFWKERDVKRKSGPSEGDKVKERSNCSSRDGVAYSKQLLYAKV